MMLIRYHIDFIAIKFVLMSVLYTYIGTKQILILQEYDKMCCNSLEALDKFEDGSEECMKDDTEEWEVCRYLCT